MHMRYALESTILALKAMERSVAGETESHLQEPFCFLKDLQSHLEAITNFPRKVIFYLQFKYSISRLLKLRL